MDKDLVVSVIATLAARATGVFTPDDILRDLCTGALPALRVDGAGVMIRRNDRNEFVYATAERIGPLEQFQELMQSGPCADSIVSGVPVVVADLMVADRWPEYAILARANSISSVLAVPLMSRGRGWGVLDLYCTEPRSWSTEQISAARLMADVAVSYFVMAHDRDLSRAANAESARRASHDDLTGLPNRFTFLRRLEESVASARRGERRVALIFVDVDLFKTLNDSFGHSVGDSVLAAVAERLRAVTRTGDIVARFAGDEFVLTCTAEADDRSDFEAQVAALTARIQSAIAVPLRVKDTPVFVTVSIGVSIAASGVRTPTAEELLVDADGAMYTAKREGRGRIAVRDHTARTSVAFGYTEQLGRDLVHAFERDEFVVYYQPIVDATTHRLVAVEALIRWEHAERGTLAAGTFIEIAERTGVIVTLGRWVINEVCRQMSTWKEYGDRAPAVAYVNVSAIELADATLGQVFVTALADHGVEPAQIGIEVVEEDLNDPVQRQTLFALRTAGHPLSIDDFGTGYSSLSRLLQLPADLVKVDRAFVEAASTAPHNVAVIDAVVQLAGSLHMDVVAEGVETAEQGRLSAAAGCNLLQGYLFGAPQRPAELQRFWT